MHNNEILEDDFIHDPLGYDMRQESMPAATPAIQLQQFIEGFYPAGVELTPRMQVDLDCYANDERRAIRNSALIKEAGVYGHLEDTDQIDGALQASPEELELILAPLRG